jgi:hypothetical protein
MMNAINAFVKMIAACTAGAESNMTESSSSRDRPNTGYYKQLHNLTTDIFYKAKTGKRRKPPKDIFYEVERVISRRVINRTVKTSISPRADGAKRRARVLIPPAIYTRGNESISEV